MTEGLTNARDAYGQILLAELEGRRAQEIMERDDGLIYAGSPADYFAPFRRWPAVERRAMRLVKGRVLDVGCGAGRASLYLQGRGTTSSRSTSRHSRSRSLVAGASCGRK